MEESGQNANQGPSFKDKTIEELLKASFKDPSKTKLSNEAVKLTNGTNSIKISKLVKVAQLIKTHFYLSRHIS